MKKWYVELALLIFFVIMMIAITYMSCVNRQRCEDIGGEWLYHMKPFERGRCAKIEVIQ